MPLIEDALRNLWGGSLAKGDDRITAAFPDAFVEELAADIGARPEALAPGLAFWAAQAAKEKPATRPVKLREELLVLATSLEAAHRALVNAELKLFKLSTGAFKELIAQAKAQVQPVSEVPAYFMAEQRLVQRRLEVSRSTPRLKANLNDLLLLAKSAADGVDVHAGPLKRKDLRKLVGWLSGVFEEATGRNAGRAWDAYEGERTGRFGPFCQQCLEALNIPCGSLDKIVQDVARTRQRKGSKLATKTQRKAFMSQST
jgi:hypothetical protein